MDVIPGTDCFSISSKILNDDNENPTADTNTENMKQAIKYENISTSESIMKKIKSEVPVKEYIHESYLYQDVELRANDNSSVIKANRIVLAAASPFFKLCLKDAEDGGQIIITDCCFESLSLALKYLHFGCLEVSNLSMKKKVEQLIERLQIGIFDIKNLGAKDEPSSFVAEVKVEPIINEDNAVENYYNYLKKIKDESSNSNRKRKKADDTEWRENVISSLYHEENGDAGSSNDEDYKDDDYNDDQDAYYHRKPKKLKTQRKSKLIKNFICEDCDKKFSSQDKLDVHKLRKHTNGVFKCEHCPKTFTKLGDRGAHEKTHSKPFKCDQCDMSFGRKSNLDGHMRLHRGERPYICDICGKGFPMQSSVTTHKRQSHPTDQKPWVCDFCERRFVSKSQLELHRRVHTGEKPWVCDTCGKGFAQKQNMIDHKRVHSDKLEYNCHTCGQQFKWKLQLERHMMDHTGVRPYPCDQCSLAFKCRNGLKSHKLSVHSDQKHFVCQHCGSGFSTSSGVSRHQKNNRCSGLKSLAANERERTELNSINQHQGNTANAPEIVMKPEKLLQDEEQSNIRNPRDAAMIQSMQYLQNIAVASNYPLSLAMHRQPEVQNHIETNFRPNL